MRGRIYPQLILIEKCHIGPLPVIGVEEIDDAFEQVNERLTVNVGIETSWEQSFELARFDSSSDKMIWDIV
jgi:hypothetical protein